MIEHLLLPNTDCLQQVKDYRKFNGSGKKNCVVITFSYKI
jgi:hypothetical protein